MLSGGSNAGAGGCATGFREAQAVLADWVFCAGSKAARWLSGASAAHVEAAGGASEVFCVWEWTASGAWCAEPLCRCNGACGECSTAADGQGGRQDWGEG